MALTPLTLQAQVKKHIQVILERLLPTVNRRVIVLDRENPLRVSPTAPGQAPGVTGLGLSVCVTAPRWPCCHNPAGWGWMSGMCPGESRSRAGAAGE